LLAAEEFGEQRFALLNWLAAQILAVKLKQIERAEDGTRKYAVAADQIKDGKPVLVANNRFAVDQARMNRQLAHRHCDKGEARREIVSGAGNQPHACTVTPSENAEVIMLDFVKPAGTGRRSLSGGGQTRFDNPQSGAVRSPLGGRDGGPHFLPSTDQGGGKAAASFNQKVQSRLQIFVF